MPKAEAAGRVPDLVAAKLLDLSFQLSSREVIAIGPGVSRGLRLKERDSGAVLASAMDYPEN